MVSSRGGGAQAQVPFFSGTPPSPASDPASVGAPASDFAPTHPHVPSSQLQAMLVSSQTVPGTTSARVFGQLIGQLDVVIAHRVPLQYACMLQLVRMSAPYSHEPL